MDGKAKELCIKCGKVTPTKVVDHPGCTEYLCGVCGAQVDCDMHDDYYDGDQNCHYCGGEGWGIEGHDWDCHDPLWIAPGTVRQCPCCHGSGGDSRITIRQLVELFRAAKDANEFCDIIDREFLFGAHGQWFTRDYPPHQLLKDIRGLVWAAITIGREAELAKGGANG